MKNYKKLLLVLVALFIVQLNIAQPTQAIKESTEYLKKIKEKYKLPGLSVCVGVKGKIVWQQGWGFANIEQKTLVTPETQFRVGSISKCMTSLAVGKLYQQGKLRLDADVRDYVPYYPKKKYSFSVRQLAGHIAGVPHYKKKQKTVTKHYTSVKESMTLFDQRPLLFEPGTQYQYSSYGYNLLSAVIEGASKKSYLKYMKKRVFKPLGMTNTIPDDVTKKMPNRATLYHLYKGKIITIPPAYDEDVSYKWAGGGFLSTPTDLVKMMHNRGKIIKDKTFAVLTAPQKFKNGEKTNKKFGVGIAWRTEIDKDSGYMLVHHGGASTGGRSFLLYLPKKQIVVALAGNALCWMGKKEALQVAKYFVKTL